LIRTITISVVLQDMSWWNEPGEWSLKDGVLRAVTEDRTDFWHETLTVHCRGGDRPWQLLRLGYLDLPATVDVGVMCCSPERAGLEATFRDFRIGPPIPPRRPRIGPPP
jgi:regulation of enolase protein 1 (concanavalin A-like superfamily)